MTYDNWEHFSAGIESVATTLALVLGGIWAYWRFWRQREGYGRMDLTAELNFLGRAGVDWVVEIIARVDNKGLVRHWIHEMTFKCRYLLASDPAVAGGPNVNGQLVFPQKGPAGSFFPKSWRGSFVEAGGCNVYRFVITIPAAVRFVLIQERFKYQDPTSEFHVSQRVFVVPTTTEVGAGLPTTK